MTSFSKHLAGLVAVAGLLAAGRAAAAPEPWGTSLQPAFSPVAQDIHTFGGLTMWIITPVVILVLALLVIVMVRFNAKANPVPSRTSHNTLIEVVWTVAPILILLVIAVPSFRLLYEQQTIPEAAVTVKVTGNKWYWSYEYPDNEAISFDSYMVPENEITDPATQPRLLAVDLPMVVPVGKVVRIQVTGSDVIHSFAMPTLGVKIDAMPGRLNEAWFQVDKTGIFWGQCSELCGQNHAFMPIEIRAVTDEQFAQWVAAAKDDPAAGKALLTAFQQENTASTALAQR